jgi:hypothetical protein
LALGRVRSKVAVLQTVMAVALRPFLVDLGRHLLQVAAERLACRSVWLPTPLD